MVTEYEAKFFPINKETIRTSLNVQGAVLKQKEIRMKRVMYHISGRKWLRVRDEGDQTTITVKEVIDPNTIEGVREVEIVTNSFEDACNIFKHLNIPVNSYQENDRETWLLDDACITIDTWPGLEPLLEIEGKNAGHVMQIAEKLNLDFKAALFGTVDMIYHAYYGIDSDTFNSIPHITFENTDVFLHHTTRR